MSTRADPGRLLAWCSRALVAFTIEVDNAVELAVPHRTTRHGRTGAPGAPYLVSVACYANALRFVPSEGATVRAVRRGAWWLTPKGLEILLRRLSGWWRYCAIAPDPERGTDSPRAAWVVRLTPGGQVAAEAWARVLPEVDDRWRARLGAAAHDELAHALGDLLAVLAPLPDCVPLFDYDLGRTPPEGSVPPGPDAGLFSLLSGAVMAHARAYAAASSLSLPLAANLFDVLGQQPVRVADLPQRTGLGREAIDVALGQLARRGVASVGREGRAKVVTLTARGQREAAEHLAALAAMEASFEEHCGAEPLLRLERALEPVAAEPAVLLGWIVPDAANWRAELESKAVLPRFPLVSHRGGFPDGS